MVLSLPLLFRALAYLFLFYLGSQSLKIRVANGPAQTCMESKIRMPFSGPLIFGLSLMLSRSCVTTCSSAKLPLARLLTRKPELGEVRTQYLTLLRSARNLVVLGVHQSIPRRKIAPRQQESSGSGSSSISCLVADIRASPISSCRASLCCMRRSLSENRGSIASSGNSRNTVMASQKVGTVLM